MPARRRRRLLIKGSPRRKGSTIKTIGRGHEGRKARRKQGKIQGN